MYKQTTYHVCGVSVKLIYVIILCYIGTLYLVLCQLHYNIHAVSTLQDLFTFSLFVILSVTYVQHIILYTTYVNRKPKGINVFG